MNNLQIITDKAAIGFSLLCALHCLLLPVSLILSPSLAALPLSGESFHLWLLAAVIPTSIYALSMGCNNHKRFQLFAIGGLGLVCMISAVMMAHTLGELWEKPLTVVGAGIIALAHYRNYRLCKNSSITCCEKQSVLDTK